MSKPKKKLNARRRRFVEHYTNPNPKAKTFGNGTRTAIAAGYSEHTAKQGGSQVLANIDVQHEIQRVLDAAGATEERCAEVLTAGLEAKDTKVFCQDGEVVYSEALIDFAERRLTAAEVLKLRGRYPTNRTVERLELLRIQNTLIVVPGGLPEPEEKAKQVRQLTD
ncbi:hypothetical protein LCGC14_0776790 [marine sediment metagenome]|uniref:Terminase small subunit n=1 Tax=marine sediment metagenome TaxID=412755 RepID=A0A0F9PWX1_9ZZZZ